MFHHIQIIKKIMEKCLIFFFSFIIWRTIREQVSHGVEKSDDKALEENVLSLHYRKVTSNCPE